MQFLPDTEFSKQAACNKIDQIYQAVSDNQQQLSSFGFSSGILGVSLFNCLYAVHSGNDKYKTESRSNFETACDIINEDSNRSYPQDFAELGIITHFLCNAGILDFEPNQFLSDLDTLLLKKMRAELKDKNIGGFINGALGYGLYFLHRSKYDPEKFSAVIAEIVKGIIDGIVYTNNGCYWNSGLNQKKSVIYLSIPHGSAAVILFLTKVVDMGLFPEKKMLPTISSALSFIRYFELADRPYHFLDKVDGTYKNRISLCSSDMGIGYSLLRCGSVFNNENWLRYGMAILSDCATRRDNAGVQDAGILYGASGLATMFNRIHYLTNEPLMKEAAQFWYSQILKYSDATDGYAGFQAAFNQWHTHTNLAFSEGIIGIGCGLMKGLKPGLMDFDDLIWLL